MVEVEDEGVTADATDEVAAEKTEPEQTTIT